MTNLLTLPGTFLGHTWKQDSLFGLDSQSLSSEQWGKLDWAQAGTAAGLRWGEVRGPSLHAAQMGPVTPDWPCQPAPVLSLTYSRDLGRPGQGWPEDPQRQGWVYAASTLGSCQPLPRSPPRFPGWPLGGDETPPLNSPPHGALPWDRGHILALTAAHPGNSQAQPRVPASA